MSKKLSYEEMVTLAREMMNSSVQMHDEALPGEDEGVYVCEMMRGGWAVMVAPDGSMLFADSSTSFEEHLEAFRAGTRTEVDK